MTNTNAAPIACTLTGSARAERVAWIAQLNQEGLRSHDRTATSLVLHYAPDVRERVHQLVRQETECCAFLTFDVDDAADGIRVTITLPDDAREHADPIFEPFVPANDAPVRATTGCCHADDDTRCAGNGGTHELEAALVPIRSSGAVRTASTAAVTTAAGAVACGVCCVLPFAFPAVAAAGAGGVLAWFARAQGTMTLIASAIVGVAWLSVGLQSCRSRKRPTTSTLYAMGAATLVLGVAMIWPSIEPSLIRWLDGR